MTDRTSCTTLMPCAPLSLCLSLLLGVPSPRCDHCAMLRCAALCCVADDRRCRWARGCAVLRCPISHFPEFSLLWRLRLARPFCLTERVVTDARSEAVLAMARRALVPLAILVRCKIDFDVVCVCVIVRAAGWTACCTVPWRRARDADNSILTLTTN